MGENVTLTANDGHQLDSYVARPAGQPLAGLVVLQEIFGVNSHIRAVADGYARDGFLAIAPALFDRIQRNVQLGYEGADLQKAMSFMPKLDMDNAVEDTAAALDWLRRELPGKRVGVIGYCWGGSLAWLAASRLHPDAAVGYYGGYIPKFAGEKLHAPVMLHFGTQDTHIPKADVDKVQQAHPDVPIFWYDAGHGFNCDERASYQPEAARVARERSLVFLRQHLAG
jgi:carboxymethylenebutenolidase